VKTYDDPDIGLCDDCGSDAGRRRRVFRVLTLLRPEGGTERARVGVWLCAACSRRDADQ
jgi:hypothetical protein